MADCPYARCIQEKKHIRRELLRWTKNMVFVVGLERVAEELMGRRKWKQYQDSVYSGTRTIVQDPTTIASHQHLQLQLQQLAQAQQQQQQQQAKEPSPAVQPLKVVNLTNNHRGNCAPGALEPPAPENGTAKENGDAAGHGGESPQPHHQYHPTNHQHHNQNQYPHLRTNGDDRASSEGPHSDGEPGPEEELPRAKIPPDSKLGLLKPQEQEHGLAPEPGLVAPGRTSPPPGAELLQAQAAEGKTAPPQQQQQQQQQITPGLLRVKKEEELQEPQPGREGGGAPTAPSAAGAAAGPLQQNNGTGPTGTTKHGQPTTTTIFVSRRPSPPPEDWKPLDKCYFCLDGKLQQDDQPPLSPQSDSSQSSRSAESPVHVDPMTASAVAAALSGGGAAALASAYPSLLPQWCLPPREPPGGAGGAATTHHPESMAGLVDQPLDLSAKPKSSQDNSISLLDQHKIPLRLPPGIDPKTLFNTCYRTKARGTATGGSGGTGSGGSVGSSASPGPAVPGGGAAAGSGAGRRTYTEDELQAALRDIQSGKLGTRRAAVLYGIPRSTLRNKVYKLAMERERDAGLGIVLEATGSPSPVVQMDDKELSGAEDEKEVEKALLKPLISLEDLVRFSSLASEGAGPAGGPSPAPGAPSTGGDSLRALLQRGHDSADPWAAFEQSSIAPYIQKMLAAAAASLPFKAAGSEPSSQADYLRRLGMIALAEEKLHKANKEQQQQQQSVTLNGDQSHHHHHHQSHHHHQHQVQLQQQHHQLSQLLLQRQAQQLHQHLQQQQQQRAPMTNDDFNPQLEDEASDSGQGRAILKIPSFKPGASGSGANCAKNGSAATFAGGVLMPGAAVSPGLLERASPAFSGTSSPTNSLVGKSVPVSFRDVIAKSISVKFQQEGQQPAQIPGQGIGQSMIAEANPYKRGRYTPPAPHQHQSPQAQQQQGKSAAHHHHHHQQQHQQQDKSKSSAAAAGGKGTRPKRGKYRNYDRDSLVEAVRAVQRGEMSVHRAGSYYGVPHSTLEYKVKERHLMRPRKRDQKQAEEKAKESGTAGSTARATSQPEKKTLLKAQKAGNFGASGSAIPGAPNGMKMPAFIDGMPPMPFGHPFNFWGPSPFMGAPFMTAGGPNVPGMLPEQYFSSARLRGAAAVAAQDTASSRNSSTVGQQQQQQQRDRDRDSTSSEPQQPNSRTATPALAKSPRDLAESLYDGANTNGSFLDSLIRSSLEKGISRDSSRLGASPQTAESSKSLIEQLCRTPAGRLGASSLESSLRGGQESTSEDEGSFAPKRGEHAPTIELSPYRGKEEPASSPSPSGLVLHHESQGSPGPSGSDDGSDSGHHQDLQREPQLLRNGGLPYGKEKQSACDSKLIVVEQHGALLGKQQAQQRNGPEQLQLLRSCSSSPAALTLAEHEAAAE